MGRPVEARDSRTLHSALEEAQHVPGRQDRPKRAEDAVGSAAAEGAEQDEKLAGKGVEPRQTQRRQRHYREDRREHEGPVAQATQPAQISRAPPPGDGPHDGEECCGGDAMIDHLQD